MGWLTRTKAAPDRKPTDAPKQASVMYLQNGTGVALIQWNNHIAAQEALSHPIVFRALDKIATSVGQVPLKVVVDKRAAQADQSGKELKRQALQTLLDNPNDDLRPTAFRYWMGLNYASYGRIPVKIGFSATKLDTPNGIYPLETANVLAHMNARGTVDAYDYGTDKSNPRLPSKARAVLGQSFVEQIWKPALKGFQHKDENNTPLQSVGLPAAVIKALLRRALETAEGHPNVRYLVTTEKELTNDQQKALSKFINDDHGTEGAEAGRVPILRKAGKIEVIKLENDLSDIHSKMPSDDMARLIFGAFGIPIAIAGIGAGDAAKFTGNFDASVRSFWEDTIEPSYLTPICEGLTHILCPTGLKIIPDLDGIAVLRRSRITSMKELNDVSFLTNDEKRAMFNVEPATDVQKAELNAKPTTTAPTVTPPVTTGEPTDD